MSYPIQNKLVIAVASSALFDLTEAHQVFVNQGEDEYRKFQRKNKKVLLEKGIAFPFVRRFLNINLAYPQESPVEVVLLSRNDPDTGQRVFNSIQHYQLNITRAGFLSGKSPYFYMPAFNASLFLSANRDDVIQAIQAGYPAGQLLAGEIQDTEEDKELRVAFDFDGVLADDEAESIFQKNEDLDAFCSYEVKHAQRPHQPGPLASLFKKLAYLQKLERQRMQQDSSYLPLLRIAIVTARSAPANERVVTTLNAWGVLPDETFFLGGMDKNRILEIMRPHIFFDDQMKHLSSLSSGIPAVHIPFGIRNI